MTSTLQRLQAKGFVAIEPDPRDGRAKRVSITPSGRLARDQSIAAIAPALADLVREIGRPKLELILPVLIELRTFLDQRRNAE